MPRLLAVCTGRAAALTITEYGEPRTVVSGIVKTAIGSIESPRPVPVGILGLEGDDQVDHLVHGGPDKAVYVYPVEHYPFWHTVRGQGGAPALDDDPQRTAAAMQLTGAPLPPGMMGENLLVSGLPETEVWVGDRLRIGETELRVEKPRQPCYKLNARLGFKWATKMMQQSGYTGYYCSVVRIGRLAAGDAIELVRGPRVLTVADTHRLTRR